MDRWRGRVALVTGAGSGIGAEVARVLTKYELIVYGCDKNQEAVEKLLDTSDTKGQGQFHPMKCDLRHEHEILAMFEEIKKNHGGVDICINCAGLCQFASLLKGSTEDWKEMLDVNVLALCICTREAVKQMQEKNVEEGHIIHIISTSGHRICMNLPEANFYAGTKHMVTGLTEGLRQELGELNSGIKISSISPSDVDTNFHFILYGEEQAKRVRSETKLLKTADIADMVVYLLQTPPHVQIHNVLVRAMGFKS
ncbi:dehydrogenase/reductase SDR family member 11-like [Glandiceps talaboti]